MKTEDIIRQAVELGLSPIRYELVNDSGRHKGHAGDDGSGQTHFNLMIVSEEFEGKSRVERQRMVNNLLSEAFSSGLHAISLKLLTPDEVSI